MPFITLHLCFSPEVSPPVVFAKFFRLSINSRFQSGTTTPDDSLAFATPSLIDVFVVAAGSSSFVAILNGVVIGGRRRRELSIFTDVQSQNKQVQSLYRLILDTKQHRYPVQLGRFIYDLPFSGGRTKLCKLPSATYFSRLLSYFCRFALETEDGTPDQSLPMI